MNSFYNDVPSSPIYRNEEVTGEVRKILEHLNLALRETIITAIEKRFLAPNPWRRNLDNAVNHEVMNDIK